MTQKTRNVHPVDLHVGARIRQRRILMGLSQERMGDGIGLTFQQVQKYEKGANRVSASRLHDIATVLDVPVSFFFDDMDEVSVNAAPGLGRQDLDLIRVLRQLSDGQRKALYGVARSMLDTEIGADASAAA